MSRRRPPHRTRVTVRDTLGARRVPPIEGTENDIVVCVPGDDSLFADDVYTTCAQCGITIHHRPFMPVRAKKVCLTCAKDVIPQEARS